MTTRSPTGTRKKSKRLLRVLPYLMLLPSMALLVTFIVYPILSNFRRSFQPDSGSGFTLEHYAYFFTDPIQRAHILYTLRIVVITTILTILPAYGFALFLRFTHNRITALLNRLYILPRFIPGLVAVNGMITVIRDSGLINRVGRLIGQDWQLGLMYDAKGIILMNLWFNIPFAALLLSSALMAVPNASIEAARDVGAKGGRILLNILLPLTYKDILIAATFVFMGNIGSFTTPYLMGENHPQMLGITLFQQFGNGRYERAAALAVIMFLFSGISAVTYIYTNMREDAWEKAR